MMNENIINEVLKFSERPDLFGKGTGCIWTEPYISNQMLKAHLDYKSDGASRNIESIEKTMEFLESNIKNMSEILDLGCGPGLYAERLCKSGYKVTGIDFSEGSINYAKNSADQKGLDIEYKCEDILDINYNEKFDAIIQIYGEVNTFSDKDRDRLFKIVKSSLRPGGLFIFDVSTPVCRRKNGLNKNWYISQQGFWREGEHLVLEEGFEYNDNIYLDQYVIIDSKGIKVYRNWFHDYTIDTIKKVVLENEFSKVDVIRGLYCEDSIKESEWLTVIAQK